MEYHGQSGWSARLGDWKGGDAIGANGGTFLEQSHLEWEEDEDGFKIGMFHKLMEFRKKAAKEKGQL